MNEHDQEHERDRPSRAGAISVFDSDLFDEETKAFLEQKTNETHGLLKRTASNIHAISINLRAVQQRLKEANAGHRGLFLSWLHTEFEMSQATAYRFMQIAARFREDELLKLRSSSISALYALAGAEASVVEQVREGVLPPTLEAIRQAKSTHKQAEGEHNQPAQEDEGEHTAREQEREQATEARERQEAHIGELSRQLAELHQQIVQMQAQPGPEPTVIEKPVIPQEMQADLERLRRQVEGLTRERERLIERVEQLGAHNRAEFLEQSEVARHQRVRQQWRSTTAAWERSTRELSAHWPTLLETESFGQEEWAALHHIKDAASELAERCEKLERARAMVVDSGLTNL